MNSPVIYTLDCETKPTAAWVWGLYDQNVGLNQIIEPGGLMTFAAKRMGDEKIEFHAEWQKKGYSGMVRRLHEIYNEADGIIGYNSAGFDSKWIKGAFAAEGLTPPSPYKEIDLYRVVRKNFKFPSMKLAHVCRALGLETKVETGGFQLWADCINPKTRDAGRAARKLMAEYNSNDVAITESLYFRLRGWVDGFNWAVFDEESAGEPVCTGCGSLDIQWRGKYYATSYCYPRFQCQQCGKWGRGKRSYYGSELRAV